MLNDRRFLAVIVLAALVVVAVVVPPVAVLIVVALHAPVARPILTTNAVAARPRVNPRRSPKPLRAPPAF